MDGRQRPCFCSWKRRSLLHSCDLLLCMDLQRMLPSDPIDDSICSVTRTLRCFQNRGSTCTNRTLRMREWLTDFRSDVIALGGFCHSCFSHSSSLSNKMQPRLAVGSLLIYSNRRFPSTQKENFSLFSIFGHGDPAVALNKFLKIAT